MDLFPLIAAERLHLADSLGALGPDEWEAPSLCAGWTVHVVGAHLNAPWEASIPSVAFDIVRARSITGGFDRLARRLAERMTPADCVAGLRLNADSHFTPPGFGPEAPLTDVIVHGIDMLLPSGRAVDVDPLALAACLEFVGGPRSKNFVPKGLLDGLVLEASDLDVRVGKGRDVVRGPALALSAALCGRPAVLDQLSGEGVPSLRSRQANRA
jgi:uncharacterized protein (TIGR03083 family)